MWLRERGATTPEKLLAQNHAEGGRVPGSLSSKAVGQRSSSHANPFKHKSAIATRQRCTSIFSLVDTTKNRQRL